jgi:hypothetical protein
VVKGYAATLGRALVMRFVSDEPDVGDALELQAELALFARFPGPGLARRAVGGGLEPRVAETALPALEQHDLLSVLEDLGDLLAGVQAVGDRPQRHAQHRRQALAAVAVLALAVLAALAGPVRLVLEVDQVVLVVVAAQDDVAPLPAVAAVRAAPRLVFFAAKADAAAPSVAGPCLDDGFVDEHWRCAQWRVKGKGKGKVIVRAKSALARLD